MHALLGGESNSTVDADAFARAPVSEGPPAFTVITDKTRLRMLEVRIPQPFQPAAILLSSSASCQSAEKVPGNPASESKSSTVWNFNGVALR